MRTSILILTMVFAINAKAGTAINNAATRCLDSYSDSRDVRLCLEKLNPNAVDYSKLKTSQEIIDECLAPYEGKHLNAGLINTIGQCAFGLAYEGML